MSKRGAAAFQNNQSMVRCYSSCAVAALPAIPETEPPLVPAKLGNLTLHRETLSEAEARDHHGDVLVISSTVKLDQGFFYYGKMVSKTSSDGQAVRLRTGNGIDGVLRFADDCIRVTATMHIGDRGQTIYEYRILSRKPVAGESGGTLEPGKVALRLGREDIVVSTIPGDTPFAVPPAIPAQAPKPKAQAPMSPPILPPADELSPQMVVPVPPPRIPAPRAVVPKRGSDAPVAEPHEPPPVAPPKREALAPQRKVEDPALRKLIAETVEKLQPGIGSEARYQLNTMPTDYLNFHAMEARFDGSTMVLTTRQMKTGGLSPSIDIFRFTPGKNGEWFVAGETVSPVTGERAPYSEEYLSGCLSRPATTIPLATRLQMLKDHPVQNTPLAIPEVFRGPVENGVVIEEASLTQLYEKLDRMGGGKPVTRYQLNVDSGDPSKFHTMQVSTAQPKRLEIYTARTAEGKISCDKFVFEWVEGNRWKVSGFEYELGKRGETPLEPAVLSASLANVPPGLPFKLRVFLLFQDPKLLESPPSLPIPLAVN